MMKNTTNKTYAQAQNVAATKKNKEALAGRVVGFPVIRYTYKKLIRSWATLIFFLIAIIPTGVLIGISVSQSALTIDKEITTLNAAYQVTYFTIFLCAIFMIFMAMKGTQIFRDEIDDGTLLVILSKPISRKKLMYQKWVAYQLINFSFLCSVLLVSLTAAGLAVHSTQVITWMLSTLPFVLVFSIIFQFIFTSIYLIISLYMQAKIMMLVAAAIAIMFLILNIVLPLLVAPDLIQFQKNELTTFVSPDMYHLLSQQSQLYKIISIFNIAYHFQDMFGFALQGFTSSNELPLPKGSSMYGGGVLDMFTLFKEPVFGATPVGNTYEIVAWKDFINPWILYVIYIVIAVGLLFSSYFILKNQDFR